MNDCLFLFFFLFMQNTAYDMRISDWSSDVCSSDLIPNLLEEMLRFDGPVQMLFRHTTRDTELAGVAIPKGSLVLPLLGSANHDERKFDRSEELVLDRDPKEIMSFGQGPHFCLGSYLSRMEAKSALEILTARFESIEAIGDTVKWSDSYFARGPKTLPVWFKAR